MRRVTLCNRCHREIVRRHTYYLISRTKEYRANKRFEEEGNRIRLILIAFILLLIIGLTQT